MHKTVASIQFYRNVPCYRHNYCDTHNSYSMTCVIISHCKRWQTTAQIAEFKPSFLHINRKDNRIKILEANCVQYANAGMTYKIASFVVQKSLNRELVQKLRTSLSGVVCDQFAYFSFISIHKIKKGGFVTDML